MEAKVGQQGFYSVLRWRSDATRDEARNVAVILVEPEGQFGGLKAAPLSTISPRLHEQGLLDAMLQGLEKKFADVNKPNLSDLERMHASMYRSLYLTEPQPVVVSDVDSAISALYKAYVSPRQYGLNRATKGAVLDRVVAKFRKRGYHIRRGEYIKDFLIDAVIEDSHSQKRWLAEVLSFFANKKTWIHEEEDAGHFLYARGRLGAPGIAVIQPPTENSDDEPRSSYERVLRWFNHEKIAVIKPTQLDTFDLATMRNQI